MSQSENTHWMSYAADFNAMTDDEIAAEESSAQALVDEQQDWLDAVASWRAAGKPRTKNQTHEQ